MKSQSLTSLLITMVTCLVITSCSKYEDGPAFSLRTKKARLSGEWTIESYTVNDVDKTGDFIAAMGSNYLFEIEKDNTYRVSGIFADTGKWEMGEDKDDVFLTSNTSGSKQISYRITRLKNKELWLRQTQSNGDIWLFKYKQ